MSLTKLNCALLGVAALLCAGSALTAQSRDSAWLKAKVSPGRAGVFVDGKYVGPAANFRIARKYALAPGRHEVKLIDPRYEEASSTVELVAGKTTTISNKLKPLPPPQGPFGKLRTRNADKFAAVYLNDKFYGHVDEFSNASQGVLLPAGSYTVRIEPLSGGGVTKKVQIEVGKTVIVE
jgi:hypothetical protein